MTTPILDQQREHRQPSRLKNLRGAVINIWLGGQHDTVDLAKRFHITEAQAYGFIANRDRPMPVRAVKAAFAGKGAKRAKSVVKPVVTPASAPRPAGCQYRLRDGLYYLHQSGEGKTPDPRYAWKGSAEQAVACCAKFPDAAAMSMELVL